MLRVLLLAILFLVLSGAAIRRFYRTPTEHDEIHYAVTADGVRLCLYRYRPAESAPAKRPVLMVHGYSETHAAYELPGRSLPRHLADQGHDVFVLELRGHGGSVTRADGKRFSYRFTLDDHALKDLPAAIEKVKQAAGAGRVGYVGHSMGGTVLAMLLARHPERGDIERAVAIASPCSYGKGWKAIRRMLWAEPALRWMPKIPLKALITLGLLFTETGVMRQRFIANRANLKGASFTSYMVNGIGDVGMGITAHFAHMIRRRRFVGRDGFDYGARLANVTAPILWIAGDRDTLVPKGAVTWACEAIGSPDTQFVVFGKKHGHRAGYGHGDLLVGDAAPDEVWPVVAEWLAR